MAKILLVEDDNNLREIYEARLQAEGYEIVSARDGEEALVVAKSEKPDLVISDVMMPKISGFEMLDILRNTDGLKHVRVIMLTALGQSDDQQRADKLGADRYLVKSQVTLEDIVKAAHDLLGDSGAAASTASAGPNDNGTATSAAPTPAAPTVAQSSDDKVMDDAVNSLIADTSDKPDKSDASKPGKATKPPASTDADDKDKAEDTDQTPSVTKKVIKPLDKKPGKDIQTLLAEEEAKENGNDPADDAAGAPIVDTMVSPTQAPAASASDPAGDDTTDDDTTDDDAADVKPEPTVDIKPEPQQKSEETDSANPMPAAPTAAAEEAAVDAKIEDFVAGASTDPTPPSPLTPTPETKPAPAPPASAPAPSAPAPAPTPTPEPTTAPAAQPSAPPAAPAPAKPGDKPPGDPNIIAL